jgi:hypothetical protein
MNPHIFQAARLHSPIEYPKPDGVFSFDVPTSLHRFVNIQFDDSVQLSFNFVGWIAFSFSRMVTMGMLLLLTFHGGCVFCSISKLITRTCGEMFILGCYENNT